MTFSTAVDLRSAEPADAGPITDLFLAARADAMPYLPRLHSDAQTEAWITHVVLPSHRVWVAVTRTTTSPRTTTSIQDEDPDGTIVGFAAVQDDLLEHLYLRPDRQRQGIGSLLLARAKAGNPGGLRLHVFQRNVNAIAFYRHHGFTLIDTDDGARNEENEPDATYGFRPHQSMTARA